MSDSHADTECCGDSAAPVPVPAPEEPVQPVAVIRVLAGDDGLVRCVPEVLELKERSYSMGCSARAT